MMVSFLWFIMASLLPSSISAVGEAQVPAMFIFGDSLIDSGNNNALVTLARADYSPNGIDFPLGVTGRFCNGGTVADHLGNLLGLPYIPPFNNQNTKGSNITKGVNYASAASGILNDTGKLFGDLFAMDEQIQNFNKTVQELSSIVGNGIGNFLEQSLFFLCSGNNDYINNYLLPLSDKPKKYTPDAYSQLLIQEYSRQLKDLYNLGGRKFCIAGVPPLGCIPNQIGNSNNNSGSCVEKTNALASQYNTKLKAMVHQLNTNLQGSSFLYWDIYNASLDIIDNYAAYGFKYANRACCGGGKAKGQIICLPLLPLECKNRSEFVFWDPYHPTDAFNAIVAKEGYQGTLQATYPRNVQQLVQS